MRVAILGDASGWLTPTLTAVRRLGVGVDLAHFAWPDDLVVVQVGDLIDRGPDGDDLVAWVDEVMQLAPRRWLQLVGNHEARLVGGPDFIGRCGRYDVQPRTIATLRRWMEAGQLLLGVGLVDARGEEWLVTHAGLTAPTWVALGAPATAAEAADSLEDLLGSAPDVAFRPGGLLAHATEPGVVWASSDELYGSWLDVDPPFSQVHGHSQPYRFESGAWAAALPRWLRAAAAAATSPEDEAARRLRVPLGRRQLVAVDPSFGARRPWWPLVPLVFEDAALAWPAPPIDSSHPDSAAAVPA